MQSIEKDEQGNIVSLKATGEELSADNKPKTFIHWVCEGMPCEVRMYEPLLGNDQLEQDDESGKDFMSTVNRHSLKVCVEEHLVFTSMCVLLCLRSGPYSSMCRVGALRGVCVRLCVQ